MRPLGGPGAVPSIFEWGRPAPGEGATVMATHEGYCVKCRAKRQFEGVEVELANGRRAAQGTCPVCGTKMNRMLGAKK